MNYRIARQGQIFGPYSLSELQQYLATGQVLPTDLVQDEVMQEWRPLEEVFSERMLPVTAFAQQPQPGGLPRLYRDPPNLPWWVALILGIVTGLGFFVVWDIVQAAWLRRVQRPSTALALYIVVAIVYVFKAPVAWHSTMYNLGLAPPVESPFAGSIALVSIVLLIASRLVFRRELLAHFNGPEPIGLSLNWLLTLLFGGLYFQYHFNRINSLKKQLRISVPGV
jgi:hypothetical protein